MQLAIQRRVFSLALQVACCFAAESARAAEPAEPDPPPPAEEFYLRPTELYAALETEYEQRRVHSPTRRWGDTVHKNEDLRLGETLGLTLDGNVLDPNFLQYRAALEFGLSQTRFVEEIDHYRDSERDFGFLQEYDVSIDALQTKPISLNAYARRAEDRVPRRFLPSLREVQTEAGVSALMLTGPVTTEVGLSWRDVDRSGNRRDEDDEDLEVSRFYLDQTWAISDHQRLRVQYDHDREQSTYQGSNYSFDTRSDEVRVEHELAFGPDKKHRLDTFLRYNEEQGDLARDELELVPTLTLQHTDKLQTKYRYGFYRFEQDAIEVGQHKFDVEGLYKPTDDLRLTLDGFGLYERADLDVDTSEFGGGADLAYHRPTSLGELDVNGAFAFDSSRTVGDAGRRFVRDEAHQLGGLRPVYLKERGIMVHSVIAHNLTRTRYYVPGIDYTITPIDGRIRVRRTFTGRIAEDEVVYFDYQYVIPAHASVDSYRTDFLIEHEFKIGLTPYYAYESRCEDVDASRATPWRRDNSHRHRFGLRYEKDRFGLGSEYEVFDDSVEPYDAWHLTGRAAVFRSTAHSLDLSAELSRYFFEGGVDDRRVWWFDMDVKDRFQLNPFFTLLGGLAYRWEDDSFDGKTNGVDVECGIEFRRGHLTVDLTVEYDLLAIAENRENGFGVFLNVRRDLSHLLPSAGGSGQ